MALGVAQVSLPLVALAAGYPPSLIGVLAALSALAQLASRGAVGWLLARLSDRQMTGVSSLVMATACLAVIGSTAIATLAAAHCLMGASRGFFWTGTQIHAVRRATTSLRGIAEVNGLASVGMFAGPAIAGLLATRSLAWSLGAATVLAGAAAGTSRWMTPHTGSEPASTAGVAAGPVWRRRDVMLACAGSAGAGAWGAMLASYVPILLVQGGHPPAAVGLLASVANAAHAVGSLVVAKISSVRFWLTAALVLAGCGLAVFPATAGTFALAAIALGLSGLGAGALLTIGPAHASDSVPGLDRAAAIAATGTARAAALFVAPMAVAGTAIALPVALGVGLIGVLVALPSAVLATGWRHQA